MKTTFTSALLCALLALPSAIHADTLNFDTITAANTAYVPSNYGGFNFPANTWGVIKDSYYASAYGNSYGSPSGEYAAYNVLGALNVALTDSADFSFQGADVSAHSWFNGVAAHTSLSLTINGYDDNTLVGTVERIIGDHGNVIGLSLPLFRTLLADVGLTVMDLWP